VIENVQPQLDGGRYPVTRLAGEPVRVTADIFKEGHDDLAAVVRWRQLTPQETEPREEPMRFSATTRGSRPPITVNGLYAFSVEAWPDSFRTWSMSSSASSRWPRRELRAAGGSWIARRGGSARGSGRTSRGRGAAPPGQEALLSGPSAAAFAAARDPALLAAHRATPIAR